MHDLIYASATALARAIRTKEVSAIEVVQASLQRIAEVNPALNAVVQLCAEAAQAQARAADAALARGQLLGPLHGVPMTIKDSLDTAGVITTGGTQGRATFVPAQDAPVVARLRAAGAILLGKTNTPELTLAGETDNVLYGRTNNPYDLSRTPGGSSGGAAAIVAAGGHRSISAVIRPPVSGGRRTVVALPASNPPPVGCQGPAILFRLAWGPGTC
jgi:amidase